MEESTMINEVNALLKKATFLYCLLSLLSLLFFQQLFQRLHQEKDV